MGANSPPAGGKVPPGRRPGGRGDTHSSITLRLAALLLLVGCGGGGSELADESIFSATIRGTSDQSLDAAGGRVTKLLDVTGDWNEVSVAIAQVAKAEGWSIEAINCVGTGNDVIARKQVEGRWLLLEAGAGTRGAGLIVSVAADQRPPGAFSVTGRCLLALEQAAGP